MEHYILFYSNNCIHCKELAQLLYKSPLYEKFQKVCIDDLSTIPKEITEIPTIIVPRINRPLKGKEAFHWIKGINTMEGNNKQDTSNNNNSNKITGIDNQVADPTNNANNGIQAYSNTMGGYSDNFSFLDNNNPMEHSFSFLNGNSSQITTPTEDFNNNNKIKTQTDINYDRLVEQRNSETPQRQKII